MLSLGESPGEEPFALFIQMLLAMAALWGCNRTLGMHLETLHLPLKKNTSQEM